VVGGYSDYLIMAQQNALDQAATNAAVRQDGDVHLPSVPKFRSPQVSIKGFPSAKGGGGGFHVEPTQLTSVSSAMGSDVNSLGDGLSQLNGAGPMGQLIAAGWDTSNDLGANAGFAYDAISTFMQDLQNTYHSMAGALRKTAENYTESDSASASAANGVASEAG
jgi:hypothetical protein